MKLNTFQLAWWTRCFGWASRRTHIPHRESRIWVCFPNFARQISRKKGRVGCRTSFVVLLFFPPLLHRTLSSCILGRLSPLFPGQCLCRTKCGRLVFLWWPLDWWAENEWARPCVRRRVRKRPFWCCSASGWTPFNFWWQIWTHFYRQLKSLLISFPATKALFWRCSKTWVCCWGLPTVLAVGICGWVSGLTCSSWWVLWFVWRWSPVLPRRWIWNSTLWCKWGWHQGRLGRESRYSQSIFRGFGGWTSRQSLSYLNVWSHFWDRPREWRRIYCWWAPGWCCCLCQWIFWIQNWRGRCCWGRNWCSSNQS